MSDINGRKYCKLIVYGCQGNVSDGERMAGQLKAIGYERTEDMEQADLILINTCCVRETAEDKVYGKIVNLLSSPLGEMLRKARHIYREQPFCRLLPASRFYPEAKDPEARIFLQGVIDLLFEDEQGRLVLVDYKTDRGLTGNQAIERYKTQLSLYQESVAELLSRKVDRCYLYLLQNGIMAEL